MLLDNYINKLLELKTLFFIQSLSFISKNLGIYVLLHLIMSIYKLNFWVIENLGIELAFITITL